MRVTTSSAPSSTSPTNQTSVADRWKWKGRWEVAARTGDCLLVLDARELPSPYDALCREQGALTLEAYDDLGRTGAILNRYLERTMELLPSDLGANARAILRAMVTSKETKDLLSLEKIVRRTRLNRELLSSSLHELISIQRLVSEVPGEPVLFELSHESLTVAISEWLDAEELRIREIAEIVNQEMANARKHKNFTFPEDKLKLIDDYREELDLDLEATKLLIGDFVTRGPLDPFWAKRLRSMNYEDRFETLVGIPPADIYKISDDEDKLNPLVALENPCFIGYPSVPGVG